MLCTRPYIRFAVDLVLHYQNNPGFGKRQAIKRVKRYACGAANLVLCYKWDTLSQKDT